jgi:hypothetical protein
MSKSNEKELVVETQEVHEGHIVIRFNFPKTLKAPPVGALILCQARFGIVTIIDMNFDETQIGDIVVELMHNGICTRHMFG